MRLPDSAYPKITEDLSQPATILVAAAKAATRAKTVTHLVEQGYDVLECSDGPHCLEMLGKHQQIELVLCDLNMPPQGAGEFLAAWAKRVDLARRPVIVFNAGSKPEALASCLMAGAVDFIRKPFLGIELLTRVQNVLLMSRARQRLAAHAFQDPLTGLYNHRVFSEMLDRAVARALRRKSPLGLILADLDRFKSIHGNYGHQVGDQVLKEFARRASAQIRHGDLLARYGGQEFAIIASDADLAATVAVAERVHAVLRAPIATGSGEVVASVSLGVAALNPVQKLNSGWLLEHAGQALREAKRQGRDRVVCAS